MPIISKITLNGIQDDRSKLSERNANKKNDLNVQEA